MDLTDEFRRAFETETVASIESIDSRRCSNDRYAGTEYSIVGEYVPIGAIVDVVNRTDGHYIDEFGHIEDGGFVGLEVFVVEDPVREDTVFL